MSGGKINKQVEKERIEGLLVLNKEKLWEIKEKTKEKIFWYTSSIVNGLKKNWLGMDEIGWELRRGWIASRGGMFIIIWGKNKDGNIEIKRRLWFR